jgi:uncharacterized protein with HEPN domain
MAHKNPLLPQVHIRDAIDNIQTFAAEAGLDRIDAKGMFRFAVERNLEIISEASRRIPEELRAQHPKVDWRGIATIGNVLRHMYEHVNTKTLREVVEFDLPSLATVIDDLIAKVERDQKNG